MNEQLLKLNGLSLDILAALSFESHLGIPLKKNLHYFDKKWHYGQKNWKKSRS